jgi:hypothetical protein
MISPLRQAEFGKEVKTKTWMPERLNKELEGLRGLPNHLKRVQVCQAYGYYLAEVISAASLDGYGFQCRAKVG